MTTPIPNDEPLAIIEEEARAMAHCFGVAAPDAAAASLIDRLLLRLGGAHIYFPRQTARQRQQQRDEIVRRFNGRNLAELAREYGLSARHVRRILTSPHNIETDSSDDAPRAAASDA